MRLNKKDHITMKTCQYRDSELKLYLSGTLQKLENQQIQHHLEQCEICNQRVELLIEQMVQTQDHNITLDESRKSVIIQMAKKSLFVPNLLKFAALLMVVIGLAFAIIPPNSPETYQVTTKTNHNFNNHQYIIEISKPTNSTSAETLSTYLIDTSYEIQLAHNFDKLKNRLTRDLSNLPSGHKISLIINGATSNDLTNTPKQLDTQELLSLIYKTRLKSRPQLLESIDNSLEYISKGNVAPENFIIFSNNQAISLANTIKMRLKEESLPNTKLSFALN